MSRNLLGPSAVIAIATLAAACGKESKPTPPAPSSAPAAEATASSRVDSDALAAFAPLPAQMASKENPITDEKVALGRMLYYDKRLSKNHDVACNSCHELDKYGVDGTPVSTGHKRQHGTRNAPTVYNAAGHIAQFWDGRAPDVEEQAKGPVLNPVEMATPNDKRVIATLESIPGYVTAFKRAFPDDKKPITFDNFAKAVGAFERKLVTPSRWDRFLAGDTKALSDQEKRGFNTFFGMGCPTCHTGAFVGGSMFQKVGLMKAWPDQKDQGRYEVTRRDMDRMMFKVPSLRNVTRTGPWFHDGSATSLSEAVRMMALHQLGKTPSDGEVRDIVAWLGALTGDIPEAYVKEPELPPSTPATPKPDPN